MKVEEDKLDFYKTYFSSWSLLNESAQLYTHSFTFLYLSQREIKKNTDL